MSERDLPAGADPKRWKAAVMAVDAAHAVTEGVVSMPEVVIDGVQYVPVSQAHIALPAIEDAIVGQWAGDNWRTEYPDASGYLRVIVTDDGEEGSETVTAFAARLLAAAERTAGQSPTASS